MKVDKRIAKEENIFKAAEAVFAVSGFKNTKMEDIATEAGITKVTLYSYFQSKENLYMGVTYKALQKLIDNYYDTIDKYKANSGLEASVAIVKCFMDFCEDNYLYSEALLDYFSIVRSSSSGKDLAKIPESLQESIYFQKMQDLHNLPYKLAVKEIERGKEDGSIQSDADSMLLTLHAWTIVIGYIKVISASGENATLLFNVSLKELKELNLSLARSVLLGKITGSAVLQ